MDPPDASIPPDDPVIKLKQAAVLHACMDGFPHPEMVLRIPGC